MTDSTASSYIGSYLVPDTSYITTFISGLRSKCNRSDFQTGNWVVHAHNAMALYTMEMLCFVSGHRAVSDPFHDICLFDTTNLSLLIEDKVVSASHHARIAWLPPTAISQFKNYLSHLRSLSRFIRSDNVALSAQIWAVTEPDYPHPIPLFFLLQERDGKIEWLRMQPADVASMLGDSWILPLNTNRHLLSTWLHRNGCPPEVIDAQLGHIEAGCSPFNSRSPLAPVTIGRILVPYLESYLKQLGWGEAEGLTAPRRLPIARPPANSSHLNVLKSYGPGARTLARENTLRKDADAVLKMFKDRYPAGPPDSIPDSEIDELQERLVNEAPDGRILIRLSLFRRHLIKLRRAGILVKVPGRLALANKEPSCFDTNSIKAAAVAESIRDRFLEYLSSMSGTYPDHERRIAEVIISSIVFGAQSAKMFHASMAKGLGGCIFRINDDLLVDTAFLPQSPIRRWFPDEVSRSLLLGYWKSLDGNLPAPSMEGVNRHLDEILGVLGLPRQKKRVGKKAARAELDWKQISRLCYFFRAWWALRLPGAIRGYAEGDNPCASVPLSNWLRLTSGKRGTISAAVGAIPDAEPSDDIQPIPRLKPEADYRQAKEFWDLVNAALGSPGKDRSGNADSRSNARKSAIESRIQALLNDKANAVPPICGLIASWLIHLCRHGTSHKPKLAASTITTYGRTIGERLISLSYDMDFLSLPDLSIEEIYRDVLETATVDHRSYVASRLREFHGFLVSTYAFPQLDWSEVIDDDSPEAQAVDAGIITFDEYETAMERLAESDRYAERDRLRYFAFLFFAYRFGLRTGEIARLALSDVIFIEGTMVVYARNSFRGETKSDNGIRQMPLIGRLSQLEEAMLRRWLAHVDTYADGDPLSTLLPQLAGQRELVDRSACVNAVVGLLRSVTGDDQVRLRHLRHTCATRLFLAMVSESVPAGGLGDIYRKLWKDVTPEEVRKILVGDRRVSRRGLYAMALFMGHSSPDVTFRHYVHLADAVLREWLDQSSALIDDKALAYAYQTSYANIRKLRSRSGNTLTLQDLSKHFIRQSGIPMPELSASTQLDDFIARGAPQENSGLSLADVDRLLALATLRDSADGLADRFLTSARIVNAALLAAARLQEHTGFTDFGIPPSEPEDVWLIRSVERYRTLEKESQRVRKFLHTVNQRNLPLDRLKAASRAWVVSYHPHSTHLLVKSRSDLLDLLAAFDAFGVPKSDLEALLPNADGKEQQAMWNSTRDWLNSQGLSIHPKNRLPVAASRYHPDNRIGLMLRASESHNLGYQRTLDRALFVISVWLQLPGIHENGV